jgi:hypothetical protein
MTPKPPKPKKCKAKGCSVLFTPHRMGQKACGPACAQVIARSIREQHDQRKRSDERKADRAKHEELKTKPQLTKEAQDEFNRYIRLRDAGRPCICCDRPLGEDQPGGSYDAGHYRSVGSAPHLRFDERNVHAQRKRCNLWGAGRAVDYRLGLIKRVGIDVVEALESDQAPKHYTRDDLRAIKAKYRAKANALQKEAAE